LRRPELKFLKEIIPASIVYKVSLFVHNGIGITIEAFAVVIVLYGIFQATISHLGAVTVPVLIVPDNS